MDAAYYEDLAGRLYGLVQWLHHVTEVGEYGLALEDMAAMLTHVQIAITDQERDDMLALARQMEIDNRVSDALRSCPHADSSRRDHASCPELPSPRLCRSEPSSPTSASSTEPPR